jgi:D-alanyl-D-alanine carboxypeptidase (penicillin-binding protein 5/6)
VVHRWFAAASFACLTLAVIGLPSLARAGGLQSMARDPYVGAIVVESDSGRVLFDRDADRTTYPASVTKLMTLLVVLEHMDAGLVTPSDRVKVTGEAARTGGSQIFLREGEVFTMDDLLYALMVQSANDAAIALATHVAGSRAAFVAKMNAKAQTLGMSATRYSSPHGLPPAGGGEPDVTTARDVAVLARVLLREHPEALRYTSARSHPLRGGKFTMRTHNRLLDSFAGCDGLKTGYFSRAGYSIAATAVRDGTRLVAVVLGSKQSRVRDREAATLLMRGFQTASSGAIRTVSATAEEQRALPID